MRNCIIRCSPSAIALRVRPRLSASGGLAVPGTGTGHHLGGRDNDNTILAECAIYTAAAPPRVARSCMTAAAELAARVRCRLAAAAAEAGPFLAPRPHHPPRALRGLHSSHSPISPFPLLILIPLSTVTSPLNPVLPTPALSVDGRSASCFLFIFCVILLTASSTPPEDVLLPATEFHSSYCSALLRIQLGFASHYWQADQMATATDG